MKMNKTKSGIKTTGIPSQEELEASPGYPKAEDISKKTSRGHRMC